MAFAIWQDWMVFIARRGICKHVWVWRVVIISGRDVGMSI